MQYMRAYAQRDDDIANDPSKPVTFVASTEGVKRDGADLKSEDWRLERYRKHGPVLWAHDYWGTRLPIGLGRARIEGRELLVDVSFDIADTFAMQVRAKALKGMIGGSVGWDSIAEETEEAHSIPSEPLEALDVSAPLGMPAVAEPHMVHELLEFSMVPVPMDPDALPLRQMRAWQDMQKQMNEIAEKMLSVDTDTSDAEDAWPRVAAEMVELFVAGADDADRQRTYNDLERQYRGLDKVAPELCSLTDLGIAEIRGLFLEGEPEMYPDRFAEPVEEPLILTVRQKALLAQAIGLLQEALAGAEDEPEDDELEDDTEPKGDEPEPDDDAQPDGVLTQLSDMLGKAIGEKE